LPPDFGELQVYYKTPSIDAGPDVDCQRINIGKMKRRRKASDDQNC